MKKSVERKKKKGDSAFSVLVGRLGGLLPLFVFVALVVNVFVVYRFESTRKPQVVYSVERVFVNTNTVAASSSPVSAVSSNSVVSVSDTSSPNSGFSVSCSAVYDFFVLQGRRAVKMWDRFFNEGSPTSYGRIVSIFPDRILLDNGSYIVNSKWSSSVRSEVADVKKVSSL